MRLVAATLTLTGSVALGALAPAQAVEKTVHVPFLHCDVTVTTYDASVSVQKTLRHGKWEISGYNSASQSCVNP